MAVLHKPIGKPMSVFETTKFILSDGDFYFNSDNDICTLVLILVISLLPVFVREFRNSARLTLAYWFVVALHQGVACVNAFFKHDNLFITPGATKDAGTFHIGATYVAQSLNWSLCCDRYGNNYGFFENLLGTMYWLFGSSSLLGSQFSILMFAISCIVLVKIMGLLELSHYKVSTLFVFGSLPSMIFFGSVPLRESYELLFFMLATYFGLRMLIEKNIRVYGVFMVVSVWVMGLFHPGLGIYGILLIALFIVWNPHSTSSWLNIKKRHLIALLTMLALLTGIIYLYKVQHINLGVLSAVVDLDLQTLTAQFQKRTRSIMGRTTYSIPLDFSSPFMTAYSYFLLYVYYLFAPFPWQINNLLDVGAFMESMSRMVLLYFSVMHWYHAYGVQRRLLMLMLILFFGMSFMWALGTSNYGTATRHNILSWWILAITGVPLLMKMLSRFWLGLKQNVDGHIFRAG